MKRLVHVRFAALEVERRHVQHPDVEGQLAAAPRHRVGAEVLEPGAPAEGVRAGVGHARVRDEERAGAVVSDAADDEAQCLARDPLALPLRLDVPPGLPCGYALVLDLPVPDAADGDAVHLDAEHPSLARLPQPQVARLPLHELLGGLGPAEECGHLGGVRALEKRKVVFAPPLDRDRHPPAFHASAPIVGGGSDAGNRGRAPARVGGASVPGSGELADSGASGAGST